jgi:hypothetical protein
VVVVVAMLLESLSWSTCKPPYINIVNFKKITHICIFLSWKSLGLLRCLLRTVAQVQTGHVRDLLLSSTRIRISTSSSSSSVCEWMNCKRCAQQRLLVRERCFQRLQQAKDYGLLLDALLCITGLTEILTYKIKKCKYYRNGYYVIFSYDMNRKCWNRHTVVWPDAIYEIRIWAMQNRYVPRK